MASAQQIEVIDWLTLAIEREALAPDAIAGLEAISGTVIALNPDGEVDWTQTRREVLRSDTHTIQFQLTMGHLLVFGSPARVVGPDNVFGTWDVDLCGRNMIEFVESSVGVVLPDSNRWECRRIDVTRNFHVGDGTAVRQALRTLGEAAGGRYQARNERDSVYWNSKSRWRKGKAYAKGPHLRYLFSQGKCELPRETIDLCEGLLRLELTLGGRFFSRLRECSQQWYRLTEAELRKEHDEFFSPLCGGEGVAMSEDKLKLITEAAERVHAHEAQRKAAKQGAPVSPRPHAGAAMGAYRFWLLVSKVGYDIARQCTPKTSFYRHRKLLIAAGFSLADIKTGTVQPFRFKANLVAQPVEDWASLRSLQAA